MKKKILSMKSIAYISALGGVEIKEVEYGIDDYVIAVSGAWTGHKRVHHVKIRMSVRRGPYIVIENTRLYLDEAIRM